MLAELLCVAILNMGMPNADVACDYMEELVDITNNYDVKPEVLVALVHYESRWNSHVVSHAGACGLTQVIPKFTKRPRLTCRQLKNPITSLRAGTRILSRWVRKYGLKRGLCGYNAGYSCNRAKRMSRGWQYSRKVRKMANRISREVLKVEQEEGCDC
jgi:soluble lytic murein transglycosylase-like protein